MFGHFVGLALKGLKYDHALKSLSHVKLHNINYTLLFYTFFRICLLLGKIQYQLLKWPRKTSRNGFYVSCRSNRQTETFWKIFSKSSTRTPPRMFSWDVSPTYKTPLDLWSSLLVKELAKFQLPKYFHVAFCSVQFFFSSVKRYGERDLFSFFLYPSI